GSLAAVDAVIARAEAGEDFVADRADGRGDLVDAMRLVNEIDERTGTSERRIDPRHVERHEIHRDASDDRDTRARDAGGAAMARRAQPAIGVADGDRGDAAGALHAMRRTVTNGYAGVNVAHLHDSAFEANDLRHSVGMRRRRVDTVERGTRADH